MKNFQFKDLSTWPILKFVGKDLPSNVNVGPFERSHRIAAVRHPWLISGGGLPEVGSAPNVRQYNSGAYIC